MCTVFRRMCLCSLTCRQHALGHRRWTEAAPSQAAVMGPALVSWGHGVASRQLGSGVSRILSVWVQERLEVLGRENCTNGEFGAFSCVVSVVERQGTACCSGQAIGMFHKGAATRCKPKLLFGRRCHHSPLLSFNWEMPASLLLSPPTDNIPRAIGTLKWDFRPDAFSNNIVPKSSKHSAALFQEEIAQ